MHEDDLERTIADLPAQRLSDQAFARIDAAVAAAELAHPSRITSRWWSRGVPLWLAAAACVGLCAATAVAVRMAMGQTSTASMRPVAAATPSIDALPEAATPVVSIEPMRIATATPPRVDIGKWSVLDATVESARTESP